MPIQDIRSLRVGERVVAVGGAAQPGAERSKALDAPSTAAARSKSRARISANSSSIAGS